MKNWCGRNAVAPYNLFIADHHICTLSLESSVIAVVFMFFVSLPVGCHAFVSPMLALLGARSCLVSWSICHEIEQLHMPIYSIRWKALLGSCTIGTSPLSMRWWILVACMPTSPNTVSARTCQQWQVPPWSWILKTRRVKMVECNLRVVWRGSQRVNYLQCMLCIYAMLCLYKSGGIVGGGGIIKITILYNFYLFPLFQHF